MQNLTFLLVAALILTTSSGCAAVDAARGFVEERKEQREIEYIRLATAACNRFGFRPSTNEFAKCLQAEVSGIKNRKAIEDAASDSKNSFIPSIPGPPPIPR